MKYLIILTIIIILIYYIIVNKVKIKFKTFFKRGFKVDRGIFGIYCYCGLQGSGKTYSCVEYVHDNEKTIQLFSNVVLDIDSEYIYYKGFKELLKLRDTIDWARNNDNNFILWNGKKYDIDFNKQIVFIYDEIFSELQRGSKIDNQVLDFITQMRKRKFILLTTAQIWSDIPITWRRLTRYEIDCSMKNFFGLNLLFKVFRDAENMKWNNDEQEFEAPIISTTITHTRLCVANLYDTFQLIHNKDSSFNDDEKKISSLEKEPEERSDDLDLEFWGEGESIASLTGLRISDAYVNVKNE